MNEPEIAEALQAGLVGGMRQLGENRGLPSLDWRVIVIDEVPVVEGAPGPEGNAAACLEWAESLGMQEYSFHDGDGIRSWYLISDIWKIEISTLGHA